MNYADYYDCDICNGKSVGMSLFVSGCPIHCEGCFNPETWDYNYGKKWTPNVENKFLNLVGREYIKRVSILGGSPLCDANVQSVAELCERIKFKYPEKQIWVYTGYTWETISSKIVTDDLFDTITISARQSILKRIDVLVDGPFDINKKDLSLAFRGSSNQRIIDVQKSLTLGKPILWSGEV